MSAKSKRCRNDKTWIAKSKKRCRRDKTRRGNATASQNDSLQLLQLLKSSGVGVDVPVPKRAPVLLALEVASAPPALARQAPPVPATCR